MTVNRRVYYVLDSQITINLRIQIASCILYADQHNWNKEFKLSISYQRSLCEFHMQLLVSSGKTITITQIMLSFCVQLPCSWWCLRIIYPYSFILVFSIKFKYDLRSVRNKLNFKGPYHITRLIHNEIMIENDRLHHNTSFVYLTLAYMFAQRAIFM